MLTRIGTDLAGSGLRGAAELVREEESAALRVCVDQRGLVIRLLDDAKRPANLLPRRPPCSSLTDRLSGSFLDCDRSAA